ncbi:MAG: hypothetical protein IPL36_03570 [Nigerium sp.]|nr:hypothetical protein [Nigerium sp.]
MPTPPKPKKPWFKKWWVWLIIVIAVSVIGSALGGDKTAPSDARQTTTKPATDATQDDAPAPARKEKLTLDDGWKIDKSNQFMVQVVGYVSNNTDKAITNYVQITFDALDAQGANLGTCLANTNTIDAGGKWKFKAMCTADVKEISEVRFKEITGF